MLLIIKILYVANLFLLTRVVLDEFDPTKANLCIEVTRL